MELDQLHVDSKLKSELIIDEGYKKFPYLDSRGNWTGGIGHNLTAHGISKSEIDSLRKTGISEQLINQWFLEDLEEAITCCASIFPNFVTIPDEAQRVLANMAFDLMYELRKWINLRNAIAKEDWRVAAFCILNSRFAKQASERCNRLASRIRDL